MFAMSGTVLMVYLGEHLPLQQGLRPVNRSRFSPYVCGLGEHLPLQQGLRHSLSI